MDRPEYDYGSGHFCLDNGLGDFALHCPQLGEVKSVPFMMAAFLGGYHCHCGAELKEPARVPGD